MAEVRKCWGADGFFAAWGGEPSPGADPPAGARRAKVRPCRATALPLRVRRPRHPPPPGAAAASSLPCSTPPPGSIRRPPPFPPARSHQLAVSPARFMSGELKATECGCGAVPGKAGRGRLERGRASGLVGPPGGARRPWPRRPRHADPGRGGGGRVGARGGSGHCWPRGAVVRARTRGAVSGRSGSCRPRPVCSQKGMPSNVDIIWVRRLNGTWKGTLF